MSDLAVYYVLDVRTFPVGGGHTYATIKDCHYKTIHELTRPVDAVFLKSIPEEERRTYALDEDFPTSRLLDRVEAIRLAREWMSENAPDVVLLSSIDSMMRPEDRGQPLYPFVGVAT